MIAQHRRGALHDFFRRLPDQHHRPVPAALELSEQVQRAASAVPLDSLFIDEGFGTLDPATLDTVAAAIQSLPVGGRMVGIITHSQELAEGLPARVVVEKRSEGSRVQIDSS